MSRACRSTEIDEADGGLRIGAMVTNTDLAADARVRERYPVLSRAVLNGASGQLRNQATTGGNLLQRTRCYYFYDTVDAVQQARPRQRLLGAARLQPHPRHPGRQRRLHRRPSLGHGGRAGRARRRGRGALGLGHAPHQDRRLPSPARGDAAEGDQPRPRRADHGGDPARAAAGGQVYRKVRDRASYDFALVSVAALVDLDGERIRGARIALGGVAHKPWRALEAERGLTGATLSDDAFAAAGEAAVRGAQGRGHNDFKIQLAARTVARALSDAAKQRKA